MVMAYVKCIAIDYAVFMNFFAKNEVMMAQINSWWYEDIARNDPAQRILDLPCAYMSVVNESSQQLVSLLTLCIRLSQRLLVAIQ